MIQCHPSRQFTLLLDTHPCVWVWRQDTLNVTSKVLSLPGPVSYVSRSNDGQADTAADKVCQHCSEVKQVNVIFRCALSRGFYRFVDQLYH
jgi:hypothetical protein